MNNRGTDSTIVRVSLRMYLMRLVQGHSPGWAVQQQHQRFPVCSTVVAISVVVFKTILSLNRGVRGHEIIYLKIAQHF